MNFARKILKNTAFLTGGQIVTKVINLLLILILTRILSVTDFGIFSFGFAYTTLFMFLVNLGINNLLVRNIARQRSESEMFVAQTFPIILILSVISIGTMNLIAAAAGWSATERQIILLFSFYIVFDVLSRFFIAVFRAHEEMKYEAVLNVLERILMLGITVIAYILSFSLFVIVLCFTFIMLAKSLTAAILVHRNFSRIMLIWQKDQFISILKESYPFALISVFTSISTRIDMVMLKIFHTPADAGLYNAARRIIESLLFIPENIYFAVFPALSILYIQNRDHYTRTMHYVLLILIVSVIPLAVILTVLAPGIIDLLFEAEYDSAAVALQWLALAMIAIFTRIAFAVSMNATGRQHTYSVIAGFAMIVNVLLNLLLIPEFGIAGAGQATLASEVFILVVSGFVVIKYTQFSGFTSIIFKLTGTVVITGAVAYMVSDLPVIAASLLILTVYVLILFLFGVVSRDDISRINKLMRTGEGVLQ